MSDLADIRYRVRRIVAEALSVEPSAIGTDEELVQHGAGSLDVIEIAIALEDAFAIEIEDDRVDQAKTLEDLVKAVQAGLDARSAKGGEDRSVRTGAV